MTLMSFTCGVAGVVLFAILAPVMQAIARRATSPVAPVTILAIAAVVAHGASVLLGVMTVQHFQYWNAASIFGFGVMGYVFAFGAVYKSVSLEILIEVAQRPEHAAPLLDIVDRLAPEIFRGRAEILANGGQAERAGASFVTTSAGRTLAARVAGIRRKFVVGESGLYDFAEPPQKTPNS